MIRKIIQINAALCNGCGACVTACHEGAIELVDGKARLLRDDYCDGLGDCLPNCPTGAITFEAREAAAYDMEAVKARQQTTQTGPLPCGCPGHNAKRIEHTAVSPAQGPAPVSQLNQWPVQIKLVSVTAPYFTDADLLIAADCTAYAYGDFHSRFIKNRITLMGCPKLDEGNYAEKLTAILKNNSIKSVTVVRMEVPCCAGIELAAKTALQSSGKFIPCQVVTISTDGTVIE